MHLAAVAAPAVAEPTTGAVQCEPAAGKRGGASRVRPGRPRQAAHWQQDLRGASGQTAVRPGLNEGEANGHLCCCCYVRCVARWLSLQMLPASCCPTWTE
jgi:hypothetical protein